MSVTNTGLDNSVTWMHSEQVGAPQANGLAGSNGQLLQILDAVLINGFNSQTVSSVTSSAETITLSFGTSHGYVEMQKITISGANNSQLNGDHTIIAVTNNTIVIERLGVSDTSGVIKTKVAPLGFESIFGSTNPLKRAYRSKNTATTQTVLYLDMAIPANSGYNATDPVQRASVSMCEDMAELGVQINSYTDATNNYATNPNGVLMWYQSRGYAKNESVSTNKNSSWVVIGNGDYFYLIFDWQMWTNYAGSFRGVGQRDFYMFGDMPSLAGLSDAYSCAWAGITRVNDDGSAVFVENGAKFGGLTGSYRNGYFITSANGVGGLQPWALAVGTGNTVYSGTTSILSIPNPTTGSFVFMPAYALASSNIRANMSRLLFIPHDLGGNQSVYDLQVLDGVLFVAVRNSAITSNQKPDDPVGFLAFNLRGG